MDRDEACWPGRHCGQCEMGACPASKPDWTGRSRRLPGGRVWEHRPTANVEIEGWAQRKLFFLRGVFKATFRGRQEQVESRAFAGADVGRHRRAMGHGHWAHLPSLFLRKSKGAVCSLSPKRQATLPLLTVRWGSLTERMGSLSWLVGTGQSRCRWSEFSLPGDSSYRYTRVRRKHFFPSCNYILWHTRGAQWAPCECWASHLYFPP